MSKTLEDIFYQNRNIEEDLVETDSMQEMDQVLQSLNLINEQLQKVNQKQVEHDQVLAYLNQKVEQPRQEQIPEVVNKGSVLDLFRIPDPIKSIPSFDGNRKQLTAWLKTVEDTLSVFEPLVSEQQFSLYLQAVNNKIEGKAKDTLCLAGNPKTFREIKEILLESLGDRQELSFYKSQLWATKQNETMNVHSYFNKMKEIVQNIKSLAKQNKFYNDSWPAINAFIDEDALAAFISGLRKPYFGYAQAAKPKGIEEAYAFLCKFNCNELISNNSKKQSTQFNSQFGLQKQMTGNVNQPRNSQFNPANERKSYSVKEKPIPMDVDISMRSRNTFNKKVINNHEVAQDAEEPLPSPVDNDYSQEPQEENFQASLNSDTED